MGRKKRRGGYKDRVQLIQIDRQKYRQIDRRIYRYITRQIDRQINRWGAAFKYNHQTGKYLMKEREPQGREKQRFRGRKRDSKKERATVGRAIKLNRTILLRRQ